MAGEPQGRIGQKPNGHASDDMEQYAGKIKYGEFWSTPFPFQRSADKVIEIEGNGGEEQISGNREKNKRE